MVNVFNLIKAFVIVFFLASMIMGIISGYAAALAAIDAMGVECNLGDILCQWLVAFGFPPSFLNTNTFFWYAIIPLGIIAVSIYIVFSYVKNIVPGLSDWAIGAFSILGALATVPTKFFHVFVGTTMVMFGSFAYGVMLLIGILAGVTLVERVWRYTKGALSPKMQFKEVKGMIEEEIKAGKELRGVIGDIDKQIQTLKKEIQKDWMEFDKTKTREGKIAILNRIKEKERWLEYLETIAKQRR